jgi:hypothetical protein
MARAMKKVGMNVNPDDDLDKIINDLNREIPNPKKGKTFASESKTQEKVCRIVAGVLNDEFTPGASDSEKFIDMTLPPIEICRAVGEYTHSFNQGVNTEFLGVIGSVKNALHSMNLMDQVMNELYNKIQSNIGKVDDSILEREIKPLNDVYIRAKHERDQKKMVLENLLHVHLEPASRVLNDALKEHGNDLALVKRLGLKLGSTDFANAIAAALSGLGSTASIANHVHKALKTVGISMNEYVNSHSFKEFQQKLDSIVDEGKMNDKDLVKFLTASKYLREGFDYRTDDKFKKIIAQGGREGMMGGQYSGGRRSKYNMDAYDSVDSDVFGNPLKSSIRRKAKRIMVEKELISKDFVIRLDRHYNELLEAMKDIAINLGKTIPLTTKTELLKDSLQHLDDVSSTGATEEMSIELIVSRGIDTMDARRKKEQYINKLKMIANACESIMGMEAYRATSSKFAKVKDVVAKIEKMIDYYSNIGSANRDKMSDVGEYDRKYADSIRDPSGSLRHSEPSRPSPVQSNSDDEGDGNSFAAEGGADFEYKEIDVPQIAKTGLTLNEIINTFNYYYYLAGVRNNLKISSREYDLFGEDYSNMLGNSIAKRLYELDLAHKEDIKYINENLVENKLLPAAGANTNENEKFRIEAKKWVDSEYNIKIKFYKALQALDLYLKEFTPAITSNIDTVKEIKTMLDETQVIARWFNESTGNELCTAFDQLPGYSVNYAANDVTFTDDPNADRYPDVKATSHYYKGIHDKANPGVPAVPNTVTFGNPVYGRSILYNNGVNTGISKIKLMKDSVDGAIDHFQALKNIVNTFIRIGNKFGSTDLSTKVFMSPSQIYRVLFNFLKQSALRLHVPSKAADDASLAAARNHDALMLETPGVDEQNIGAMGAIHFASRAGGNNLVPHRNGHHTVAPFSVYFTGYANGLKPDPAKSSNHYEIENVFFHAMLKAMAGKIMTVVGSYDMLEMSPPKHWITDTRMILGGGLKQIEGGKKKRSKERKSGGGEENPVSSDDRLEIIQEALPLYFKLPRLIEFYKDILEPNTFEANPNGAIVFLPDLDGLFTSLFLLIFRKTKTPDNGEYSDMELHKIVEEINSIYRYYAKQKSHDITTAVINDVVLDVNRKYGLMKKDDYNTWVEMTKERDNSIFGQIRVNTTNYSILPDEDEYEVNKFAPSDIYKGMTQSDMMYDAVSGTYKNRLTGEESPVFSGETPDIASKMGTTRDNMHPHAKLIKKFREDLDKYFKDSDIQNMSSYTILVHQAEDDVKNARSNREKISTVFQLIQGTGNLGLKNDKAILFHETIIAGLNVLSGIYMMLQRYKENIEHSDPLTLEKKLVDILYGLLCAANKTVANDITFQTFTKNGNDTYTIGGGATVQNASAAEKARIGQCHLLDAARVGGAAPILEKGGSYFFNDGISDDLFPIGDTRTKHQVSEKEHPYLIQPIMIDEPIFRGTKILPYYHINGANVVSTDSNVAAYNAAGGFGTYANDVNNLYDIKRVDQSAAAVNVLVHTANSNAPQFYYGDYGDGTAQTDIYANSHPTYRILETIVTKVNTTEANNRLFSNSKAIGAVTDKFILPSTIIDYESKKNNGVLNANGLSIRERNGALAANPAITDTDRKNLLFMRLLSRTGVNHQYIMENLLENMYSLIVDSNGLIDLTYYRTENNKTKLNLNFTKLQNVVNGIITDLKFYLEYFRPFLKKDVIAHYENADKVGSIYYLESKFNYFFNPNTDMYNTGYNVLPRAGAMNAEQLSDITSKIFNNLTRDTHVAMSVLKQLLPGVIHAIPDLSMAIAAFGGDPERCRFYNERLIFGANQMTDPDGVTDDGTNLYSMYDLLYSNYIHNNDDEVKFANSVPQAPAGNIFVKFQYNHTTRYEWYGGTMSNLIFYDFSKKMPYNRLQQKVLSETITPTFTVEDQIVKIDDFDSNSTKYKDARFATEFYCYPHGHFKLRELLGSSNARGDIKALDIQVANLWAGAVAAGESPKTADPDVNDSRLPITNVRTLYRYTAISMFSETTLNAKNQDSNPFKFDEYIQLSAQRMEMQLGNNRLNEVFNAAAPGHGPAIARIDFGATSHYPTMEQLDTYSYPVEPSNTTKNYGYNMGICVKDPKLPSKDFEYKLHDLIARSPKTSDSRASAGHLIQWPNAKNGDSAVREYIRAPLYSHECVAFDHNSLMFIFNQILSRFLNAFIDPSTGNKIYKNLVNGFINGVSSKVVSQPDTGFPDLYRCGTNSTQIQRYVAGHSNTSSLDNQHSMMFQKVLGLRGDVKPDSIVFQSLAYILQRIGKDLDRGSGSNLHLLNTLTDVPIYMKESYKANLPSFIKIFDYIIQKAEFFKNVIQKTDIKLNRYSQCDFANFINSCTGLTDVRVNDVRYELHSYFVPAKYLLGLSTYNQFQTYLINYLANNPLYSIEQAAFTTRVHANNTGAANEVITDYRVFLNILKEYSENVGGVRGAVIGRLNAAPLDDAVGMHAGLHAVNPAADYNTTYNTAYGAWVTNDNAGFTAFMGDANINNDPTLALYAIIFKMEHIFILMMILGADHASFAAGGIAAPGNRGYPEQTMRFNAATAVIGSNIFKLFKHYFMNKIISTNYFNTLHNFILNFVAAPGDGTAQAIVDSILRFFTQNVGGGAETSRLFQNTLELNMVSIRKNPTLLGSLMTTSLATVPNLNQINYAADYPDFTIDANKKAIRKIHSLYISANTPHIAPFDAQLDKIHSELNPAAGAVDGMIRRTPRTAKEDLVKISCTRGTRGYNLPFKKYDGRESIFRDYTYNYEFLKITDKNANRVNGFLSIDGIEPLTVKNQSSDEVKEKLLSVLDSIVANAYSMSDCCDEVLKELGDTPVYFETYDGSIENYQVRNNADQFMPLSLTLWFMNNNHPLSQSQNIGPSHVLFSGHNLSTANFKLLYGTRQVLARNLALTYEEIPGVKTILARHNSSASDRPLEESRYLQFVNRLMTGLRFIVNSHGYKRVVAYNSNGVEPIDCQYVNPNENELWKFNNKSSQFVGTNNTTHLLHFQENNNLDERNTVYALKNGTRTRELLLQLLEDSFQENSVNKILQAFYINEKQSKGVSRKEERIKVIIDSSINPINVHALMQDIPLANIYNYQYTFETMAASMYGMLMRTVSTSEATNEGKHPLKQTILEFLRLLRDPFAEVDKTVFSIGANYEQPLFNIFIGDGSLGMGRPKFLSDQLFNKCLLNNIYYENTRPMVKGPAPRRDVPVAVDPAGLTDAAAAAVAANLFDTANALNPIDAWLRSAPVVAANGIFSDIFAGIRAYELIANAGNGGAGTDPTQYSSTTNNEKLFRFIFNGENIANGTAADQPYLAANNKYWGIAALVRSPAGLQNAINWRLFNTFLNPTMPNPAVGNRYAELLRKSEYFARFRGEIMAQPNIINQFIVHFGIKFAAFAKLQARFELILEAIFRIIFLLAIIGGNGGNFLIYALCQTATRGAAGGILGYPRAMLPAGRINIGSVASLIRIGLFQNFNGVDPIADDTNLTQLVNDYNTKLARFPQGYNPLANNDLVMSYLKEYQYRGPFNQNTYDGANNIENTSNPLVRFVYAAGAGTASLRHTLQNIGFLRFNTNVIRNLFFISNILRIIRLQINREFTQNRSILKSSHFAISPSVTEYGMMDPNESFNSTYRDAKSFNDGIENYSNREEKSTYYDLIDEDDAL